MALLQIDALEKKVTEKESEQARSAVALKKYRVWHRGHHVFATAADRTAGPLAAGAHRAGLGGLREVLAGV